MIKTEPAANTADFPVFATCRESGIVLVAIKKADRKEQAVTACVELARHATTQDTLHPFHAIGNTSVEEGLQTPLRQC
jgi:hypothetical protein